MRVPNVLATCCSRFLTITFHCGTGDHSNFLRLDDVPQAVTKQTPTDDTTQLSFQLESEFHFLRFNFNININFNFNYSSKFYNNSFQLTTSSSQLQQLAASTVNFKLPSVLQAINRCTTELKLTGEDIKRDLEGRSEVRSGIREVELRYHTTQHTQARKQQ